MRELWMDFLSLFVWLLLASLTWWSKGIKTKWRWINVQAVHLRPPIVISALLKTGTSPNPQAVCHRDRWLWQQAARRKYMNIKCICWGQDIKPGMSKWFSTQSCCTCVQENITDTSAQSWINWVEVKLAFPDYDPLVFPGNGFLESLRSNFVCHGA